MKVYDGGRKKDHCGDASQRSWAVLRDMALGLGRGRGRGRGGGGGVMIGVLGIRTSRCRALY